MAWPILGIHLPLLHLQLHEPNHHQNCQQVINHCLQKPQKQYLYIPPSSTHTKDLLHGVISGSILRFNRCTNPTDSQHNTQQLYSGLVQCSYTSGHLLPFFFHAHSHAMMYLSHSPDELEHPPTRNHLLPTTCSLAFSIQSKRPTSTRHSIPLESTCHWTSKWSKTVSNDKQPKGTDAHQPTNHHIQQTTTPTQPILCMHVLDKILKVKHHKFFN
jgi:hypothetical protein